MQFAGFLQFSLFYLVFVNNDGGIKLFGCKMGLNTLNANMADNLVGARDELHESDAGEALVFVLTMLPLKSLVSWTV